MTVQTVRCPFFSTERLWMKLTDRKIDRIGLGKQQTERLNERNGSGPKNKPSILSIEVLNHLGSLILMVPWENGFNGF